MSCPNRARARRRRRRDRDRARRLAVERAAFADRLLRIESFRTRWNLPTHTDAQIVALVDEMGKTMNRVGAFLSNAFNGLANAFRAAAP